MDKRYQVFVSSTYADLKEERQKVIQTLMEMDCIPSGMELFPALDEEQFEFIKRVISDCDYYLLIVGARYGTTTAEGISYTEKEYDFAISLGLKVVAFLHQSPDEIPLGKTDKDPELSAKLEAFRAKVGSGRLVKFWRHANELPGLVALSLQKTIKTYPAVGWVRANAVGTAELLAELNELRKHNEELRELVGTNQPQLANLAGLDDDFTLHGEYKQTNHGASHSWSAKLTWGEIFGIIAPHLLSYPSDSAVALQLKKSVFQHMGKTYWTAELNDEDFQTVKVHLKALDLVALKFSQTVKGGMALFWSLTKHGEAAMLTLRAARKDG